MTSQPVVHLLRPAVAHGPFNITIGPLPNAPNKNKSIASGILSSFSGESK